MSDGQLALDLGAYDEPDTLTREEYHRCRYGEVEAVTQPSFDDYGNLRGRGYETVEVGEWL